MSRVSDLDKLDVIEILASTTSIQVSGSIHETYLFPPLGQVQEAILSGEAQLDLGE